MNYTHTHTNSTWLESKYNMTRFFVLATRSKYCMYIRLELCDAEGSEVDTLFVFLWHPMHENDLKFRACSTYSSLSNYHEKKKWWWYKKESLMIYVHGDWEIHERIQKYFWIFLQNPRKLDVSFMSVELIWQHPLDWRLDSSGMCRYT